ncbi:coiled-coil domain-containing protein 34 isoform X2 [Limanda limanda]|uniref:coiled-coil domain-containing protein 34 isoform X2 n=1 Tax=Limanda limanda TaxID=27771 RepID=UPI0029C6EE49|nr:coiled-coil domain-containing protein 34 isoform X2 [Limanda limanda]
MSLFRPRLVMSGAGGIMQDYRLDMSGAGEKMQDYRLDMSGAGEKMQDYRLDMSGAVEKMQDCRLVMSEAKEKIQDFLGFASEVFSSTPLKSSGREGHVHAPGGMGDGVLSEDEDTFSLLSPIYHDSFESEEEEEEDLELSPAEEDSPRQSLQSGLSLSPVRCELPKRPVEQLLRSAVQPAASPTLGAWEMWLVNKAKKDRLELEKKAEKEGLLKEKQKQEERERERKKKVMEEKIQEWLKIKTDQEKHEQLVKQWKEEEEMQWRLENQREIEQKAQLKYRAWLQKKNREKVEKEKQEKEEAELKEEQEKERRKRAEQKFKEWVTATNEKSRTVPKSPCCPTTSPYDKTYPSPSYVNPIPWKPIHTPPPETSLKKTTGNKPQKQRKNQQSSRTTYRLRNVVSAAQMLPGR